MGVVTAKALNSTLGTSNFKGFDELLYDVLSRIQMESKVLKFSETEVLMSVPTGKSAFKSVDGFKITTQHQQLMSFTLPHSGEVGLTYDMGFSEKSDSQHLNLEIYVNGTLYDTHSTSSAIDTDTPSVAKIRGNGGDVVSVKTSVTVKETGASSTSTKATIYLYDICATTMDVRPVIFS